MSFKYLLPLLVVGILLMSGCAVPDLESFLPSSGMTVSPVNQTLTANPTPGYWSSLSINKQQYNVGITRQTNGIKYLISPSGYPYGYEGVLKAGDVKTITISPDKMNEFSGFSSSIWNTGGIWRLGDTFTLTATADTVNVQWVQTGNTDPKITSFDVLPSATVGTGDSVEIVAGWDGGGDSDLLFHEWYLDGRIANGWIYVTPEQSANRLRLNGLPEGTHTIKREVWDSGKNLVIKTQTLTVSYSAGAPTALLGVLSCGQFGCTPSTNVPYGNDVMLQSYSTSNLQDPNLQNMTLTWYFDGKQIGSQYYVDTLGYQVKIPKDIGLLTVGTHTVKLLVKNSAQLMDESVITFNVQSAGTTPDTPSTPTITCPTCANDEQCVNGQCVPLPEASPLPKGTFTITVYNNQVAEVNNYQFRYRNTVTGRNDPSYQYITLNIEELSLSYMDIYEMERWYDNFNIAINPLRSEYNELVAMGMTDSLADWKNVSNFAEKKGGNVIDSGPGWSKSATYFITALTEQYATIQITEKIDTFTYCGDGTCQENCVTCPADCGICTDEQKVLYNQSPSAKFGYTVNGKQIIITDQSRDSDGVIVNKLLSFGDGNSKSNISSLETYTYADYGTYTVTLFVTDNYGALSKSEAKINVLPLEAYVAPVVTTVSPSSTTATDTTTTTTTGTTTSTVTGTTGTTTTSTPTVSGISGGTTTLSNPQSTPLSGIEVPDILGHLLKVIKFFDGVVKDILEVLK
jgi:PKD repeat protein